MVKLNQIYWHKKRTVLHVHFEYSIVYIKIRNAQIRTTYSDDEFSSKINRFFVVDSDVYLICMFRLSHDALEYYVTLPAESHREAWSTVLMLMFMKFLQLTDEQVELTLNLI